MKDTKCVSFLQWALPRLGMRWSGFRKVRGQVCKRIGRRMKELGLEEAAEYRAFLEERPAEWEVLDDFCRITISRFLRDKGVWRTLQEEVLPDLAEKVGSGGVLRAWSAGCGSGEEPYSLSLVWRLGPPRKPDSTEPKSPGEPLALRFPQVTLRILGTDAEPAVLRRAHRGVYDRGTLKELPPQWVEAAFLETESGLRLREEFREGVCFRRGDIRNPRPDSSPGLGDGPMHLVLCRNLVFTYFDQTLQRDVLSRILRRLHPGGYLVLGAHEELPPGEWGLSPLKKGTPIYVDRSRPG